ncbi:MAG: prepilin-type N-terminal cleavage/methylation domain-containing protein [Gemmatimonadales bacterium]
MSRSGFSLIEVMVAVTVLAVGILLLAGGSVYVTRDLVGSRLTTVATGLAQSRLDDLRMWAAARNPACSATQFSSSPGPLVQQGIAITWEVPTTGSIRTVRVMASYREPGGRTNVDTLVGVIQC